jgi:hypothetical protein
VSPARTRFFVFLFVVIIGGAIGIGLGGFPDLGGSEPEPEIPLQAAATTTTPTTAATPPVEAPTTAPPRAPKDVRVRLHNASSVAGGAVKVGKKLTTAGYAVLPPGANPKEKVPQTLVFFRPGAEAEAHALSAVLGVVGAQAALALPDPSPYGAPGDALIVVIVGDDTAKA